MYEPFALEYCGACHCAPAGWLSQCPGTHVYCTPVQCQYPATHVALGFGGAGRASAIGAGGGPFTRTPRAGGGGSVATQPVAQANTNANRAPVIAMAGADVERVQAPARARGFSLCSLPITDCVRSTKVPPMRAARRPLESAHALMSTSTGDDLRRELAELDLALKERLRTSGFEGERLVALARPIIDAQHEKAETPAEAKARRDARNRVTGPVAAPAMTEIRAMPSSEGDRQRLEALGLGALSRGEVAFCVMAGGMATRMGGVVKALVEVFPGHTFLDLRLRENETWSERIGRPLPLWLMTSEATDTGIRDALRLAGAAPHVKTFMQDIGLRVTSEGHLFRGADGEPSIHATGHGDLVDALRRSGLLRAFREGGGRIVWITNLDNLGATIDPAIIGAFLELGTHADVMVEVVDKGADKGGIPVHALGRLQVLEEFRLPEGFDASQVSVFNTNTFVVKAEPLETAHVEWNWFEVEKKVDGKVAVQFERLLQELTAAMPAAYLRVPREGLTSRFMPVKDMSELASRREGIEAIARARGMLT